jgi:hypothetical protein
MFRKLGMRRLMAGFAGPAGALRVTPESPIDRLPPKLNDGGANTPRHTYQLFDIIRFIFTP